MSTLRACALILLLPFALWTVGTTGGAQTAATITILHINDPHEMDAAEAGTIGGLARVSTLLGRVKQQTSPVMSTLGGDFLSPSAIGTAIVDGQPMAGRQAVAVLNLMGIDWATFGNHEFDLSEAAFRARMTEKKFGLVSTNVTDVNGAPFPGSVSSAVVPLQSAGRTIRVGLLGFTIDSNRKAWVRYLPAVDAARKEVATLRGKTDAIVAITHLGMGGDIQLANGVPEIDLVLGGHEHENWMLRRGPRLTPIMKADSNGRSAVVVTLTFPAPGQRPAVSGRIEPLGPDVTPAANVRDEVARWMEIGFAAFRRAGFSPEATVATVPEALEGRESVIRNRSSNLTDLILAAMRREVPDAAIALFNAGSVRLDDILAAGELRQYDVIRILPYGGPVVSASLEGSLLTEVLDAGVANLNGGGYLQLSGVARGSNGWMVDGQPIDPSHRYRVALSDYLLTGAEARLGFLTPSNPRVRDIKEHRDVRLALIEEIAARFR